MSGHAIRVTLPIGEFTGNGYHLDEFTPGELTITAVHDESTVRVFPPGSWIDATAYDDSGHPVCSFNAARSAAKQRVA